MTNVLLKGDLYNVVDLPDEIVIVKLASRVGKLKTRSKALILIILPKSEDDSKDSKNPVDDFEDKKGKALAGSNLESTKASILSYQAIDFAQLKVLKEIRQSIRNVAVVSYKTCQRIGQRNFWSFGCLDQALNLIWY